MRNAVPASDVTFSVVMPLYNKRVFVRPTMETVLAQQHPPVEVIVVDDGSTDGSVEAIQDLESATVKIVRQPNSGPGPARNRGAAMAAGEWIALIDADDRWHPRHLENLAGVIAAFREADVVSATSRWQPASAVDATLPDLAGAPRRVDYFNERNSRVVHTSSIAIRKTAWLAAGGFGDFLPGEDVEFWARLALDHQFATSPLPTSIYVRENGGIMDEQRKLQPRIVPAASPLDELIGRALANPHYSDRHADIAAFADRAALMAARNLLYMGNGPGAREALRKRRGPATAAAYAYGAAAHLPPSLLRALAWTYSAAKRLVLRGEQRQVRIVTIRN